MSIKEFEQELKKIDERLRFRERYKSFGNYIIGLEDFEQIEVEDEL